MPALALAYPEETSPLRMASEAGMEPDPAATIQRAAYAPSRHCGPAAAAGSLAVIALLTGAFALIRTADPRPAERRLTVLQLAALDQLPPPPPPAPAQAVQPRATAALAVAAPVPRVHAPVPVIPATPDATVAPSAPPAPLPVAASTPTAPPAPPAPPAATPAAPAAGDLSSRMVSATPPSYPLESRRRHEQGVVKLAVLVGPDGRVQEVGVQSSSGFERLDRAALSAVRHWRWAPLVHDGVAVMVKGVVTIPFVLHA